MLGYFWAHRTCDACAEIRAEFCCEAWTFTTLWQDIDEQVFSEWNEMVAIDCLARLATDAAIAKMRDQFAAYQEDRS